MWDPHVKAFLLLQTHFDRIPLPITDYVGDQTSVLDQSIRVCQAAIDVLAEKGFTKAVKMMIQLMQCIKSARWPSDGPLAIFPGVDVDKENERVVRSKDGGKDLNWVARATEKALTAATRSFNFGPRSSKSFFDAVKYLPQINIFASNTTAVGFELNIARQNPLQASDARMYAPKFPKKQTEGFFVIVSRPGTDELVALKRVGWPMERRGQKTIKSRISLQENAHETKFQVTLLSDGYIGLEWTIPDVIVPSVPKPDVVTK